MHTVHVNRLQAKQGQRGAMIAVLAMETTNTEEGSSFGAIARGKKEAHLARMCSLSPMRCVLLPEAQENAWNFIVLPWRTCTNHWANPCAGCAGGARKLRLRIAQSLKTALDLRLEPRNVAFGIQIRSIERGRSMHSTQMMYSRRKRRRFYTRRPKMQEVKSEKQKARSKKQEARSEKQRVVQADSRQS